MITTGNHYIASFATNIFDYMVKVDHIGLVNIVAGKRIVNEFLQYDAKPQAIADEILHILDDEGYRKNMITELNQVREKLGKTGGSNNLAELALEMLEK